MHQLIGGELAVLCVYSPSSVASARPIKRHLHSMGHIEVAHDSDRSGLEVLTEQARTRVARRL